ncbi:hypothetical protein ACQ4PT_024022 [Festuca glaucescens]
MAPQQRPEGARPPEYCRNSDYFSIEINHRGYFLGQGNNRSYVDGVVVCFDHVDSRTWSPAVLEDLVEDLGYEMQGRMTVYYLIPILTISRNGLRRLDDEIDTNAMANLVGCGRHYFSVYLDHDESIRAFDWDDVVEFPVVELPPVISPVKHVGIDDDAPGEVEDVHVPLQVVHAQEDMSTRSKTRLHYNNNVDDDEDKVKKMKRKATKIEGDGDSEGDDLWAPESDEDKVELKFKTFRPEDLNAHEFKIGLKFEGVGLLRRAIKEYACQNGGILSCIASPETMSQQVK